MLRAAGLGYRTRCECVLVARVALRSLATEPVSLNGTAVSQTSLRDITLRDYQSACVDKALDALAAGQHRIGISAPTGSGKTLMMASLIDRLPPRDDATKHLIVVSGRELAHQVVDQMKRFLPHLTVELDQGPSRATGVADLTVSTIQSLHRRLDKYDARSYKVIIIDEAHHAAAETYVEALEHFDPGTRARFAVLQSASEQIQESTVKLETEKEAAGRPWVVGFTATFTRADRKSLRRAFDYIAHHIDLKDLIEQKWLSEVEFETVSTSADLDAVETFGIEGDFKDASLSAEMRQPQILNEVVMCWRERASHRRSCLVFAVDVAHTIALVETFRAHGVAAGYILGEMKSVERKDVLQRFRTGQIPVLINCNVLTEGTDIPEIDTVILARPTRSKGRYWQMVGRGLRLSPQSGKNNCLVLDFETTFPGLIHWPALMFDPPPAPEERFFGGQDASERSVLDEGDELRPRTPEEIHLAFDRFDPFALTPREMSSLTQTSPHVWVACGPQKWILDAGERGRLKLEAQHGLYAITFRPGPRFMRPIDLAKHLRFDQALERGDKFALEHFGPHVCSVLLAKEAKWRSDAPTSRQIKALLKLLGDAAPLLPRPQSLNKGEVASIMTCLTRGGKKALLIRLDARKSMRDKQAKEAAKIAALEVPLLSTRGSAPARDNVP